MPQLTFWVFGLLLAWQSETAAQRQVSRAESIYRVAEAAQYNLESFNRISHIIGFASLNRQEDQQLRALFERALLAYFDVIKTKDPLWSSRSAFRIAELVSRFFKKQIFDYATAYRYMELPSPFILRTLDGQLLLNQKLTTLQNEVILLYETLEAHAQKSNKDKELLKDLQEKIRSAKNVDLSSREKIISPFSGKLPTGTLWNIQGQIYQLNTAGKWKPLTSVAEGIRAGMKSSSRQVRLSSIMAAELHPNQQLILPLLDHWNKVGRGALKAPPLFNSLQNSLFGEQERVLLALKAHILAIPNSIETIWSSSVLPAAEKAWLLSFTAKKTFAGQAARELLKHEDDLTTARALWILHLSSPKAAQPFIRQFTTDRRELVRLICARISKSRA